jgi:hypothetical protein
VPWSVSLFEDDQHRTYDAAQVSRYFSVATRAALVLAAVRAPYRGRSTPLNAWWGTFDLAVSLFSGRSAVPPSNDFIVRNSADAEQVEVGWWPGDSRYEKPAFYAFAAPAPENMSSARLSPPAARWDEGLGEYILDWEDVIVSADPFADAVGFAQSVIEHACRLCGWEPALASSALGTPPPVH